MRKWRRTLAAVMAAAVLAALSGCQSTTKDATIYVKGELDATYLGTYDKDYIDVVKDMTEADAKEKYENNVEWEAEILVDYLMNALLVESPHRRGLRPSRGGRGKDLLQRQVYRS